MFANNASQNFSSSMNAEFGSETDVNQVKQQIQQAEAKKQQASGSNFGNQSFSSSMSAEFGRDTDVEQVKRQIQQAEAKKQQASGIFASNRFPNNNS